MELPREIRDMIYKSCLAFDGPIFVRGPNHYTMSGNNCEPQKPEEYDRDLLPVEFSATAEARNLFYVSKQIRDESVAIFYRKNTFEFTMAGMERFIRRIRVRNRHHLRSVIVYYQYRLSMAYEKSLKALQRCVGLRDLTLVVFCPCKIYGRADSPMLQAPPAFEFLLRIRGLDNVRLVMTRSAFGLRELRATRTFEDQSAMEAAVQVLKEPRRIPQRRNRKVVKKRAQRTKRKSAST